jgi:hypothetical protein
MRLDARVRLAMIGLLSSAWVATPANAVCSTVWGIPGDPTHAWSPPFFVTNWFLPEPPPAPPEVDDHLPPATPAGLLGLWSESDFGHDAYWHRFPGNQTPFSATPPTAPCEAEAGPQRSETTYIGFLTTAVVRDDDDPEHPVAEHVETGQLYVGGWSAPYDASRGGPPTIFDSGALLIEGGSLTVHGCRCEPDDPNTPVDESYTFMCYTNPPNYSTECYERVGYRGARGTVHQTGGEHTVLNAISLGISSSCTPGLEEVAEPGEPDMQAAFCIPCDDDDDGDGNLDVGDVCSHGTYILEGGELHTSQIDVGVQGIGTFTMSGGLFQNPILNAGGSIVGRGYVYPTPGGPIAAGRGTFTMSGGSFHQDLAVYVGHGDHAVGRIDFSGTAEFYAGELVAGSSDDSGPTPALNPGGYGEIVQAAGSVGVNRFLVLGDRPDGFGSYEISGGVLTQITAGTFPMHGIPVPMGVYVGANDGRGEFTVVGSGSTIDIHGAYVQGDDSRLSFRIDPGSPHITTIAVDGVAHFEPGAKLKLELIDGWEPVDNQSFTLLTAASVVGESNLSYDGPLGNWVIGWTGTPHDTLVATYWRYRQCGLLGIEPVFVLLLLQARKRWRRAR